MKLKVIVRVWKKHQTPILIFPEWEEPNGMVQMWQRIGQHGSGDPHYVIQQTQPASDEEAAPVMEEYERHYNCKLVRMMKYRPRRNRHA